MRIRKKDVAKYAGKLVPATNYTRGAVDIENIGPDFRPVPKPVKAPKPKYGNTKHSCGGYTFDSGLERDVFSHLQMLERAGLVSALIVKPNVYLTDARILMIPDFVVFDNKLNEPVFHEAKGAETAVYRIKRRLWKHYGPNRLVVWKRFGKKEIEIAETVIPKFKGDV